MRLRNFSLLIFIAVFAVSCGSKKRVAGTKGPTQKEVRLSNRNGQNTGAPAKVENEVKQNMPLSRYKNTVEAYVDAYSAIAQEEMRLYNIPASITLAQGILESGVGNGELSLKANNHFGIKCHDWEGAKVYHDDDARQECFRKYKHPKYSYRDHSLFLTERTRYRDLFDLKQDDYKSWARGLKKAGYATDPAYPSKLIGLIERYKLYEYDAEVLGKAPRRVVANNDDFTTRYVVKKGDTLYSIARRYNTTVDELREANRLKSDNISIGQILDVKSSEKGY